MTNIYIHTGMFFMAISLVDSALARGPQSIVFTVAFCYYYYYILLLL